jgi:hypothetical protein
MSSPPSTCELATTWREFLECEHWLLAIHVSIGVRESSPRRKLLSRSSITAPFRSQRRYVSCIAAQRLVRRFPYSSFAILFQFLLLFLVGYHTGREGTEYHSHRVVFIWFNASFSSYTYTIVQTILSIFSSSSQLYESLT